MNKVTAVGNIHIFATLWKFYFIILVIMFQNKFLLIKVTYLYNMSNL